MSVHVDTQVWECTVSFSANCLDIWFRVMESAAVQMQSRTNTCCHLTLSSVDIITFCLWSSYFNWMLLTPNLSLKESIQMQKIIVDTFIESCWICWYISWIMLNMLIHLLNHVEYADTFIESRWMCWYIYWITLNMLIHLLNHVEYVDTFIESCWICTLHYWW
jgi:hypothetical protein